MVGASPLFSLSSPTTQIGVFMGIIQEARQAALEIFNEFPDLVAAYSLETDLGEMDIIAGERDEANSSATFDGIITQRSEDVGVTETILTTHRLILKIDGSEYPFTVDKTLVVGGLSDQFVVKKYRIDPTSTVCILNLMVNDG